MRCWTSLLVLALAACGAGDDTADGTRALCAEGGSINECGDVAHDPEAACWRMVDCGAIPLHQAEEFRFDWDNCVGRIEGMATTQQNLVMACIAAATCDQLKDDNNPCFKFGDN